MLNLELNNVYEWTIANKLTINSGKTNYLIFNRNRDLYLTGHNPIMIENKIIDEVEKGTFLCIIVQIYLK